MKRIIFILCLFFTFTITINAGEMYRCTDQNGNAIITSNPQDGMNNCVLKDGSPEDSEDNEEGTNRNTAKRYRQIKEGMLDAEVLQILGNPDLVNRYPWGVSGAYIESWTYIEKNGDIWLIKLFANIGEKKVKSIEKKKSHK